LHEKNHKNPTKDRWWNHHMGDKKGKPKKGQKTHNLQKPKKGTKFA
jgi:hypothetical protein